MPATMEPRIAVPPQAQASWEELHGRVRAVRRRHAFRFVAQGILLGWAVFAAAFLGFSLVDIFFKLSVGSRVAWLAVGLGGLAGAVFLATIRPFARMGGSVQTAREVEGAFPELENQLSTTLEYGADPRLLATSGPELVGALIERTEARTEPLDFGRTVRWRRAFLAFLLAALLGGLVALYGHSAPRLFSTTWQRFLRPTAAIAPPTLTTIERIEPGDGSYPVESSVLVSATLSGRLPETAILMLQKPDDPPDRWEERVMERAPDGRYHSFLRRLLDTLRCKIVANDTESAVFTLRVYREPQIDEFVLRLEYPEYTRRAAETLPPGVGDVSALRGTKIALGLKANTDLAKAEAVFASGRAPAAGSVAGRAAQIAFDLRQDDTYQLRIQDPEGHLNAAPGTYRLKALKDHPPRVRIRKPERDLMVHREQTVKLDIAATDDLGVGEIGLVHSLGLQEARTLIRRLDPDAPQTSVEGRHTWELGPLGLKGGEVIAYYAYALDNDALSGPKIGKSELHFLTVYDEEDYDAPQAPQPQAQGTPEAVKNLDRLIDAQKKLLQETFVLARNREVSESREPTEPERQASGKTAQAQRELKGKVEELAAAVAQEIERMGDAGEPERKEDAEGKPPRNPLGVKELERMRNAAGKMGTAADRLAETQPAPAVTPEMEALRELSETRRLLLSEKEGDPRFKMAMNDQSKKKKNSQERQKRQDMAQAQMEMMEMPPMLEREKEIERQLEKLEELKPRLKPEPQPQTEEEKREERRKEEQRRELKRRVEDELKKLADESKERAEKLQDLARRNEDLRSPAEKAQDAAEKFEQAQQSARQERNRQAQDQAHEAARDLQQAQREIRNELEQQFREQLAHLRNDAQELAQRQQDLAQATREAQPPSQSQPSPSPSQPGEEQPQPQGEPKSPQPGQQASSGRPDPRTQARMQSLAKRQGEVAGDLNALAERLDAAARQAESKQLPSAQALKEAQAQARADAPAERSARAAQESLSKGQGEQAQNEQDRAARELEQLAQSLDKAIRKTEAADLKALGETLQKAREIAREQAQVNEALAQGRPTAEWTGREEKVAAASQQLAADAQKLETLKRQQRAGNVKEQLERAASQAWEAAEQLRASAPEKAREPAGRAEQALQAALNEMERAAGQRLEDAARQAQALAREAREKQEAAAAQTREMPQTDPGQPLPAQAAEQRDRAAAQERDAARKARRLDLALEGLEEMSKDVQPPAAQIAKEARETSQETRLPERMEELARDLQNLGTPRQDPAARPPTPTEAARRGDELARTVRQIERQLDQFVAQANGTPLDRLRALEQEAKANAREAQRLAEQAQDAREPREKTEPVVAPPLAEQAGKLEKNLERLEPKLGHLEPGAPERKQLEQARESVQQARRELAERRGQSGERTGPNGGAALDKARQHLDRMSGGLTERMERILKARDVQPDEDEVAPKEYRTLVDQYYRALSEDVEEKR